MYVLLNFMKLWRYSCRTGQSKFYQVSLLVEADYWAENLPYLRYLVTLVLFVLAGICWYPVCLLFISNMQIPINPFRTEDFLIFLSTKLIFWVHLLNKSRKIQYIWHYFFNGT